MCVFREEVGVRVRKGVVVRFEKALPVRCIVRVQRESRMAFGRPLSSISSWPLTIFLRA